jgi:streptomycin 6-kinase
LEIKKEEIESIVNRFGMEFYEKALRDVEVYAKRWSLSSFQFIPSYSTGLVFKCSSEGFGSTILKIGNPSSREVFTELNTLREYNGRGFCKIFNHDIKNGVILEECIQPGNTLREENSLDKRLAVFSSLYKNLHIEPVQAEKYPSYLGWVNRITEYMVNRQDRKELCVHMKRAREICLSISEVYTKKLLLHGDFHHDNILLDKSGEYKIIDPKGVIGDPVFDIPRFILNEFSSHLNEELYGKVKYIIKSLEELLHIPSSILKQCLYVETAMSACWFVEDGASDEEYDRLLKNVEFAETILKALL